MPEYKVLSASDKFIRVCNLLVIEDGNLTRSLDVREMSGENGKFLIGKTIFVETTNRSIIPRDIQFQEELESTEIDEPEEEKEPRDYKKDVVVPTEAAQVWICSNCNMPNPMNYEFCQKCGEKKDD